MAFALLAGALLARLRRYRWHARCQSVVVLLNVVLIAFFMAPSFRAQVAPKIPAKLGKSFYEVAVAHALLGTAAEIGGLYIHVAAGTKILPQRMRMTKYKAWMRGVLVLWWLVFLPGLATYARWYIG